MQRPKLSQFLEQLRFPVRTFLLQPLKLIERLDTHHPAKQVMIRLDGLARAAPMSKGGPEDATASAFQGSVQLKSGA
jgi:hypothetical protein